MKISIVFVCSMLVASMVLQGCEDVKEVEEAVEKEEKELDLEPEVPEEEGTATCKDGKFSCDSNWKSWCSEQAKKCGTKSCTPTCTYSCGTTKCNQVCAPKCGQALCSTRCKDFSKIASKSCKMVCGQPNCQVVCPDHYCPGKDCVSCKTQCGDPVCRMECSKTNEQPCHNVCAKPKCEWECKAPEKCPQPNCVMKCQKPRSCMDTMVAGSLPALAPGETEVLGYHLPADQAARFPGAAPGPAPGPAPALLQLNATASTIRVDIATMGQDRSLKQAQVQVELAPARALTSWTRSVRKQGGKVKESEASCENGLFQCQGDEAWCSKQRETVCGQAAEVPAAESQETDVAADAQAEKAAEASGEESDSEGDAFLQRKGRQQSRLRA